MEFFPRWLYLKNNSLSSLSTQGVWLMSFCSNMASDKVDVLSERVVRALKCKNERDLGVFYSGYRKKFEAMHFLSSAAEHFNFNKTLHRDLGAESHIPYHLKMSKHVVALRLVKNNNVAS